MAMPYASQLYNIKMCHECSFVSHVRRKEDVHHGNASCDGVPNTSAHQVDILDCCAEVYIPAPCNRTQSFQHLMN